MYITRASPRFCPSIPSMCLVTSFIGLILTKWVPLPPAISCWCLVPPNIVVSLAWRLLQALARRQVQSLANKNHGKSCHVMVVAGCISSGCTIFCLKTKRQEFALWTFFLGWWKTCVTVHWHGTCTSVAEIPNMEVKVKLLSHSNNHMVWRCPPTSKDKKHSKENIVSSLQSQLLDGSSTYSLIQWIQMDVDSKQKKSFKFPLDPKKSLPQIIRKWTLVSEGTELRWPNASHHKASPRFPGQVKEGKQSWCQS